MENHTDCVERMSLMNSIEIKIPEKFLVNTIIAPSF